MSGAVDTSNWESTNVQLRVSTSRRNLLATLRGGALSVRTSFSRLSTVRRTPNLTFAKSSGRPVPDGRRWGQLVLLEKVGEGAFGEVYRAWDLVLEREVALKLLHATKEAPTLLQEARMLARLRHPSVVTIYGVDRHDGRSGIWMDFIEGETLSSHLEQFGSFGAQEALLVGVSVCKALASAHRSGLLHRDIKAENVMREHGGRIVLMDFGVGHETSRGAAEDLCGTPVYMAPELLEGKAATVQSDIYAVGVLLFHLVTQGYPVEGSSLSQLRRARASGEACSLGDLRPDLTAPFVRTVEKALAAEATARYRSAGEMTTALEAAFAGRGALEGSDAPAVLDDIGNLERSSPRKRRRAPFAAAVIAVGLSAAGVTALVWHSAWDWVSPPIPPERRVAVLLFKNIGGDPANQTLCDGLFEVVSNALARLEQDHGTLLVTPASDVRKEGITSTRQAGTILGANLAVTGSVQRIGDKRVQVMISLSDTHTVAQLRAETIRAELPDLAAIQDQVVQKVAGMLELAQQQEETGSIKAGNTTVPAAYPFYIEGLGCLRRYDQPENIEKAITAFQGAVARDPHYTAAFVGLAQAYWRQYTLLKNIQSLDAALENCSRAITLDNRLASAHVTMGMIQAGKSETKRAENEFRAALKLDPSNADAYRELATTYSAMGRADQAEATYKRAIALRHDDWWSVKQLGVFYFNNGPLTEAERCFREVIRLTPDSAKAYSNLGATYAKMGRYQDAAAQLERSLALAPTSDGYNNLGYVYFWSGSYGQAAEQFLKAIEKAPNNSLFWGNLADSYRWDPALGLKAPDTYRHAIDLVQREITVNPRDGQLHSLAAMWWAALGARKEASSEIGKALDIASRDGVVQFRSTLVHEQAGQRDRAIRALQSALKLGYPSDEFEKAPPLRAMREDPRYQRLVHSGNPLH